MPDGILRRLRRRPIIRRRRPRLPRLPRWRIATIVIASAYEPSVGPKRNLEIHIELPLREGTSLDEIEEALLDRGLLDRILEKSGYDIPPFNEVEIGIEWGEERYTILNVPREVRMELIDYDYNKVRAEAYGKLTRLGISVYDLLESATEVIEENMTVHRGKKGRRKKEKQEKLVVE